MARDPRQARTATTATCDEPVARPWSVPLSQAHSESLADDPMPADARATMEASPAAKLSRGIVFASVIAAHLFAILVMFSRTATVKLSAIPERSMTAWIVKRSARLPPPPATPRRIHTMGEYELIRPITMSTVRVPQEAITSPKSIDWEATVHLEVNRLSTISKKPTLRFGGIPNTPKSLIPVPPLETHRAGQEYRESDGSRILWVSDNCFIVSGGPPLIVNTFPGPSLSRTVCIAGSDTPRGDLFKSLPAYKKYHPQ